MKSKHSVWQVVVFFASIIITVGIAFIPLNSHALLTFGYTGIFVIAFLNALTIFIPGPTSVATMIAGGVLYPPIVAAVAAAGSTFGEIPGYIIGYTSHSIVGEYRLGRKWYTRAVESAEQHPFATILLLGAIPIFITDFGPLIAGRLRYSFIRFLVATVLGKTIRFMVTALIGVFFLSGLRRT